MKTNHAHIGTKAIVFTHILIYILLWLVNDAAAQTPFDLELWAEYRFDTPDPCADTSENSFDIIRLGEGATVGEVQGYKGGAYHGDIGEYDPCSNTYEYLPYAQLPDESWPNKNGNFTVEMMIYFDEEVVASEDDDWAWDSQMPLNAGIFFFQFEWGGYDSNDSNDFRIWDNFWYQSNPVWHGYVSGPHNLMKETWYHWVVSFDNTKKVVRHWLDGELVAEDWGHEVDDFSEPVSDIFLGSSWCCGFPLRGRIDEVRFYVGYTKQALQQPNIYQVSNEKPENGEKSVHCDVNEVCFQPPEIALVMDPEADPNLKGPFDFYVYFKADDPCNMPLIDTIFNHDTDDQICVNVGPTLPGKTYYWRVDVKDHNAGGDSCLYPGNIFSFCKWGYAKNPNPEDGAIDVELSVDPNWENDGYAATFKVYFGNDYNEVDQNTVSDAIVFAGNEDKGYDPGQLDFGKTYYWRVDECNEPFGCIHSSVWSFRTTMCEMIDDMEAYNNTGNKIYDYSGGNWGAFNSDNGDAQNPDNPTPSAENGVIIQLEDDLYNGQVMKLLYNRSRTNSAYGCAQYDFAGMDFTYNEILSIGLEFRADDSGIYLPNDYIDELYIELEDSSDNIAEVIYPGDINDVDWKSWRIALSEFTDDNEEIDLTDIKYMRIGVNTTGTSETENPALLIDNIRRCIFNKFLVPSQYPTIQAAVDAAFDGDIVSVAPGIYTGDGNRDIDTNGKAIAIRSINPKNQSVVAATVIDCNGTLNDLHRAFTFQSGETADSILDGFTITNGFAESEYGSGIFCQNSSPTITNCIFNNNNNSGENYGGSMHITNGSKPMISNCVFRDNPGDEDGGTVYIDFSSPTLTGCTFQNNIGSGIVIDVGKPNLDGCTFIGNHAGLGGGIHVKEGHIIMTNSTFIGNRSTQYGGGCYVSPIVSYGILINCAFIGNSAGEDGGGIALENREYGGVSLTNCVFINNSATGVKDANNRGGAIFINEATKPYLTNCIFIGNRAKRGGAIYSYLSEPIIGNCTFVGNFAKVLGGAICLSESYITLSNSIIWDNYSIDGPQIGSYAEPPDPNLAASYSDIQDGWPGEGNIDADPCFAEPGYWDPNGTLEDMNDDFWVGDDYHLWPGSPCIDAGSNNSVHRDGQDLDGDFDIIEPIPWDVDGDVRISDGTVDMGSDEVIWDGAKNVSSGQTVTLNPGGGPNDPNIEALVVFDNNSLTEADIEVVEVSSSVHPDTGFFNVLGSTLRTATTLTDGEFFMTVVIPFDESDLLGKDPCNLNLMYWDGEAWILAVESNTQTPPDDNQHVETGTKASTLQELQGFGLGHYGTYWNPSEERGFVWANVDHSTDFSGTVLGLPDFEPDGDVDLVVCQD